MSVARAASRYAKNTDTNNNEEGVNGFDSSDRQVTAAERAARRAMRSDRMNIRNDEPTNKVSSSFGGMKINISHNENKPNSTAPKFGSAAGNSSFKFGVDYSNKSSAASQPAPRPLSNRFAANKYTPTVTPPRSTSYSTAPRNTPGRFQGVQKDEPTAPSFGGSAQDRMAAFRAAAEKEKAQKAKTEAKANVNVEEEERKKKEAAEKKKKEEEEKKRKEEEEKEKEAAVNKEDMPDSEKMKHLPACKKKREKKPARRTMSISNIVLDWVQEMTKDYENVAITNFSSSWNNGLAFCALIHRFNPDEFDFSELSAENKRHNFDLAFKTGEKCKNIPILLDTEDMVRMKKPEPRSVQTYIQWIWSVYGPTSGYGPTPKEIQEAARQ